MLQNNEILQNIKKQIFEILPDTSVILFGSRARKDNTEDSDYDLLILTENLLPIQIKRDCRTKIRKSLLNINIFSDILIESKSEINTKITLPGHIIKNALNEGVRI